jgi:superfamily II DNA or RNA helicase
MQGWNKSLMFSPPKSAQLWEQFLGRTHRFGQESSVQIDIVLSCIENYRSVIAAHERAQWIKTTGGQTHKLLSATFEEIPTLIEGPRYVD